MQYLHDNFPNVVDFASRILPDTKPERDSEGSIHSQKRWGHHQAHEWCRFPVILAGLVEVFLVLLGEFTYSSESCDNANRREYLICERRGIVVVGLSDLQVLHEWWNDDHIKNGNERQRDTPHKCQQPAFDEGNDEKSDDKGKRLKEESELLRDGQLNRVRRGGDASGDFAWGNGVNFGHWLSEGRAKIGQPKCSRNP